MPKRGIVNVRMVITEEKILSNIEKVQRLINPNSKKQIIELDDNSYFKDLVESIKTYLIEYPKKKNFPKSVYDAAYELVEYATNQFEDNTKQIETLIKQREYNIKSASILKQVLAITEAGDNECKKTINELNNRFSEDIIEALNIIAKGENKESEEYQASIKLINARVANLESNLHIEIDMERVEDRSKALSYIGIEIADALKLIPTPVAEEQKVEDQAINNEIAKTVANNTNKVTLSDSINTTIPNNIAAMQMDNQVKSKPMQTAVVYEKQEPVIASKRVYEDYYAETRQEVKSSLWNKFKNSKFVRAIKYAFKIKIVLQLPEGLPEGNTTINK